MKWLANTEGGGKNTQPNVVKQDFILVRVLLYLIMLPLGTVKKATLLLSSK